ncbi:hypothetical protein E4U22_003732, partial [Claviceps purpurea]
MPHALVLAGTNSQSRSKIYYPLKLKTVPRPSPGPNELLVKIEAAALNHRDVFIRQ